jgi:C4-dicarboxylate-specific signal transduction histidine kinase
MRKLNVIVIAGLLALAAVLGTVAATRTVSLGASARQASAASLQTRSKQLDAYQASLRRALERKPPALPALTKAAPATGRVIYRRPPPVVVVKHTHHGDDGFEHEGGAGEHGDD